MPVRMSASVTALARAGEGMRVPKASTASTAMTAIIRLPFMSRPPWPWVLTHSIAQSLPNGHARQLVGRELEHDHELLTTPYTDGISAALQVHQHRGKEHGLVQQGRQNAAPGRCEIACRWYLDAW